MVSRSETLVVRFLDDISSLEKEEFVLTRVPYSYLFGIKTEEFSCRCYERIKYKPNAVL